MLHHPQSASVSFSIFFTVTIHTCTIYLVITNYKQSWPLYKLYSNKLQVRVSHNLPVVTIHSHTYFISLDHQTILPYTDTFFLYFVGASSFQPLHIQRVLTPKHVGPYPSSWYLSHKVKDSIFVFLIVSQLSTPARSHNCCVSPTLHTVILTFVQTDTHPHLLNILAFVRIH